MLRENIIKRILDIANQDIEDGVAYWDFRNTIVSMTTPCLELILEHRLNSTTKFK